MSIGALPFIFLSSAPTEPENTSLPWSIIVSESHISESSGRMCEEMSTVFPISLSVFRMPFISARARGSMPEAGSSRISSFGS